MFLFYIYNIRFAVSFPFFADFYVPFFGMRFLSISLFVLLWHCLIYVFGLQSGNVKNKRLNSLFFIRFCYFCFFRGVLSTVNTFLFVYIRFFFVLYRCQATRHVFVSHVRMTLSMSCCRLSIVFPVNCWKKATLKKMCFHHAVQTQT